MIPRLCIAAPKEASAKHFASWDERTAGGWRDHVSVYELSDDKNANDNLVVALAQKPGNLVFTYGGKLTSDYIVNTFGIRRFTSNKFREEVGKWLVAHGLDWRVRTRDAFASTPFEHISPDEWVAQFSQVNPAFGRKAGAALLAQFQMIGDADFARYYRDLPEVDMSVIFFGADPQSGDHGLYPTLSHNIDNSKLCEARELPKLKKTAKFRLFSDGSWSGGETKRRIRCMYTKCSHKENALLPTQRLEVRVGFLTDTADEIIRRELEALTTDKLISRGLVRVSVPDGNRLTLTGSQTGQKGLAFQRAKLLAYVGGLPSTLKKLCEQIGSELNPGAPLGTNDIASCIAFKHSLPAAVLPLFTVDGKLVTGSDGNKFAWKALVKSAHVRSGQDDDPDHHCKACPLSDRSKDEQKDATPIPSALDKPQDAAADTEGLQ